MHMHSTDTLGATVYRIMYIRKAVYAGAHLRLYPSTYVCMCVRVSEGGWGGLACDPYYNVFLHTYMCTYLHMYIPHTYVYNMCMY